MEESPDRPEDVEAELADLRNQVAALSEQVADQSASRGRRIRSVAKWFFIVLATILVVVAATAWWVHATLLDTDRFMAIVEPAITSDAFEDQLSETLSTATVEALALETRIEAQLAAVDAFLATELIEALGLDGPALAILERLDLPRLANLAAPIATALDQAITDLIDDLVRSDEFGNTVVATVRTAHESAVALATEDLDAYENVYLSDGDLVVDVLPLVGSALSEVLDADLLDGEGLQAPDLSDQPRLEEALERISAAVDAQIPDDLGQVTVMTAEQYDNIQGAAQLFDRLVWAAIALAVVAVAITIWVAPDRRRSVVQLAVAVLLALGLTTLVIQRLVEAVQEGIADAGIVDTVDVFLSLITGSLGDVLAVVAAFAIGIGIFAYLAGRPTWLAQLLGPLGDRSQPPSKADRFVASYTETLAALGAGAVLLVAWVTGLAFWWTAAALVLFGVGLWWLYGARGRVAGSDVEAPEASDAEALPETTE